MLASLKLLLCSDIVHSHGFFSLLPLRYLITKLEKTDFALLRLSGFTRNEVCIENEFEKQQSVNAFLKTIVAERQADRLTFGITDSYYLMTSPAK